MNKELRIDTAQLRMTPQRRVILEELGRTTSHPNADELYLRVRRRMPHISLGTVYRNLEILSRSGQITKLQMMDKPMRFDANTTEHYHIRCLDCGRVDDMQIEPLRDWPSAWTAACTYQITSYRLEFAGLCPQCRTKLEPENIENE